MVCLIAWNDDDDPSHKFKAEIVFKERDALEQELDLYFKELKENEAMAEEKDKNGQHPDADADNDDNDGYYDGEDIDDAATRQDEEQAEANLEDFYDKSEAIWGLGPDDLKAESTESLLNRNPDVLKILGTTMKFAEPDDSSFAKKVRPYLDSSKSKHGADGNEFEAWPLIDEVRVFVKSDILRHGIVLVDLPGLADAVESRQAVAQRYFPKLTLTTIVSKIQRGADNQTGVKLMNEHQEVCMQMDNKFHKKGFCVVLSKMDDIDVESFLLQHTKEADGDQELQKNIQLLDECTADLKSEKYEAELAREPLPSQAASFKKVAAALKAAKKPGEYSYTITELELTYLNNVGSKSGSLAQLRKDKSKAKASYNKQKILVTNSENAVKRYERRQQTLMGYKLFWCIQARNQWLRRRIESDFARRQKRFVLPGQEDLYDGKVNIFPVSASAYWKILNAKENVDKPPLGFPYGTYTGIPAFRTWLSCATIEERERQLDAILHTFSGLFHDMKAWSSDVWTNFHSHLDTEFLMREVVDKSIDAFEKVRTLLLAPNFDKEESFTLIISEHQTSMDQDEEGDQQYKSCRSCE